MDKKEKPIDKNKLVDAVVKHPNLFLRVGKKLQRIEKGTELERTLAQIENSRGKLVAKKAVKKLTVAAAEDDLKVAQDALDAVKPSKAK